MQSLDLVQLIADLQARILAVELELAQLKNLPSSDFHRPTAKEVENQMALESKIIDADAFLAHYDSQGWKKANGMPITDWAAAARSWVIRSQTDGKFAKPEVQKQKDSDDRWERLGREAAERRRQYG